MCVGPFKPPSMPAPPPPLPEEESVRQQRERLRKSQQLERTKTKQAQYEDRVAAYTGRKGRRSLLTGRRGGQGFEIAGSMKSSATLGA
jgi:hypothetical protein